MHQMQRPGPTRVEDLAPQHDELAGWRRHIHRHPELAFAEHQTADMVAGKLAQWGYEVTRGIGQTGLVAQLRVGSGNRRLGLRADMDALPIQEETGLAYASTIPGCMHVCGHDGHTTCCWVQRGTWRPRAGSAAR